MTTVDVITALCCEVDEQLHAIPKHPEAHLWPSEVVTLGRLHALKGVGNRPFSRWLTRDYRPLFPHLPERPRLFRLLQPHHNWTQVFLAAPTVLGALTPTASSSSTPCARVAARSRWDAKASPITAGWSAAHSVSCSVTGG